MPSGLLPATIHTGYYRMQKPQKWQQALVPFDFYTQRRNRSYVITYSLKKMKKEERELALLPTQFKVPGSDKFLDISTLDETAPEVYNTVYYKEYPIVTGDMDETVIITYSPKYKAYQQRIRAGQIERAIKIMQSPDKARKGKNPIDPSRFIQKTAVTGDGEIAQKQIFQLMKSVSGKKPCMTVSMQW